MGPLQKPLLIFATTSLFVLSPHILRAHPGPYTTPLADAVAWLGAKLTQAIACCAFSLAVVFAFGFFSDLCCWLGTPASISPSPSPTDLEEGIASPLPTPETQPEANTDAPAPPTPSPSNPEPNLAGRIIAFLGCSAFFAWDFFLTNHVVSSSKSLFQNVGAALLYLLRGSEVVFFVGVVACAGVWVRMHCVKPVPAGVEQEGEGEVLSEGTLPGEDETVKVEGEAEKA
ncbi:hypothetical protein B0H12DRAFT_1143286 [Mycena haematopus]|nr:hypothetical protein B0H12DRAFT_1143581 [Mycena haematopus]KAJ7234041.1 hypothetical protein B0H12DRAFT_1143286 [Mycena haematopus]